MNELDELFGGGGAPALKFANIGTKFTGVITDVEVRDQRDFDTGVILTWDDGKPRKEIVLTLNTKERDPMVEGDDGVRKLYVKAQMFTALRDAIRKAGRVKPEPGGEIAVAYTGDGEAKRKGYNPPKIYAVAYKAPAAVALEADPIWGGGSPATDANDLASLLGNG